MGWQRVGFRKTHGKIHVVPRLTTSVRVRLSGSYAQNGSLANPTVGTLRSPSNFQKLRTYGTRTVTNYHTQLVRYSKPCGCFGTVPGSRGLLCDSTRPRRGTLVGSYASLACTQRQTLILDMTRIWGTCTVPWATPRLKTVPYTLFVECNAQPHRKESVDQR